MTLQTKTKPRKKDMTAEEAAYFDRYSPGNYAMLLSELTCDCQPYEDCFTYNRWQALGFQVRRGEHGHRLPLIKAVEEEDPDTGEIVSHKRIKGASVVFDEKTVIAKFFTPDSNWTWYAVEFDGEDLFFGLVDGFEKEWGYFSLQELTETTGPLGLHIERDMYFGNPKIKDVRELRAS